MAARRMMALDIVRSDHYLTLPHTAQCLYMQILAGADDDGFCNNAKMLLRLIDARPEDLELLIMEGFLIEFPNGIVVVKHWKVHNHIQKDRYKPTLYQDFLALLRLTPAKIYALKEPGEILEDEPEDVSEEIPETAPRETEEEPIEDSPEEEFFWQTTLTYPQVGNGLDTGCKQKGYSLDTAWNQNGYAVDTKRPDLYPERIQGVSNPDTQVRLGEVSLGKFSSGEERQEKNSSEKSKKENYVFATDIEECCDMPMGVDGGKRSGGSCSDDRESPKEWIKGLFLTEQEHLLLLDKMGEEIFHKCLKVLDHRNFLRAEIPDGYRKILALYEELKVKGQA